MNKIRLQSFLVILIAGLSVFIMGCPPNRVIVPDSTYDDKEPKIIVRTLVSGNSGKIQKEEVTTLEGQGSYGTTEMVKVTPGTEFLIFCEAVNPAGGVQSLSLSAYGVNGGASLFDETKTEQIDGDHTLPEIIRIFTTSDNQPLLVDTAVNGITVLSAHAGNSHQGLNHLTIYYIAAEESRW